MDFSEPSDGWVFLCPQLHHMWHEGMACQISLFLPALAPFPSYQHLHHCSRHNPKQRKCKATMVLWCLKFMHLLTKTRRLLYMWMFDFSFGMTPLRHPDSFKELFGTIAITHSNSRNGNLIQATDLDSAIKHTAH